MAKNTSDPAAPAGELARFWRYLGHVTRAYLHVPITVEHGDVIAHDGPPADDGHWQPHPGPATRDPDNAPQPAPAVGADPAPTQE